MSKTSKRVAPPFLSKGRVKRIKVDKKTIAKLKRSRTKQSLGFLTLLWVNNSGDPYFTSGFFARAYTLSNVLVGTATFDSYGTAIFYNISTPTTQSLRIRLFNSAGVLYRERIVTAGNSAWAIIP